MVIVRVVAKVVALVVVVVAFQKAEVNEKAIMFKKAVRRGGGDEESSG